MFFKLSSYSSQGFQSGLATRVQHEDAYGIATPRSIPAFSFVKLSVTCSVAVSSHGQTPKVSDLEES
jgi:hypothetical protein